MTVTLQALVRPNIRRLEPYHCARESVQQGVLLDANENPFPRQWSGVWVNRYPDPHQRELRAALASRLGVNPRQVAAGAGSDEVLDWIFKVFCTPGQDSVAIAEPTYGMYRVAAGIFGVDIFEWRLERDFDFAAEPFLRAVPPHVKVLFLCSPNNPTGNLLNRDEVLRVCREWGGLVVVDEAYVEFAPGGSLVPLLEDHPRLVILRTLSKAFGRAGLRLGYAVAHPEITDYFLKVKAPYNLSAGVQAEGVRAVLDCSETQRQVDAILRERERLVARLRIQPGVEEVFPSQANFVLFRCRDPRSLVAALLGEGIVVRDRSSLVGLQGCVRVSIGLPGENDLFLSALARHFKEAS
jgi:histidinol-phosphate aminotransferase